MPPRLRHGACHGEQPTEGQNEVFHGQMSTYRGGHGLALYGSH